LCLVFCGLEGREFFGLIDKLARLIEQDGIAVEGDANLIIP